MQIGGERAQPAARDTAVRLRDLTVSCKNSKLSDAKNRFWIKDLATHKARSGSNFPKPWVHYGLI